MRVSGPLGSAYLRRKHDGPMLCVAGGTGLAPILSIIRGAIARGMRNPIHLYFGVRSPRDVYGLRVAAGVCSASIRRCTLHVVVTAGANAGAHRRGLVTEAIEQDLPRPRPAGAPTCAARRRWWRPRRCWRKRKGIAPERIYADAFYTQGT